VSFEPERGYSICLSLDAEGTTAAGATGAVSAAVSMMAGTYLDVSTERDRAQALIAKEEDKIDQHPKQEARGGTRRLLQAAFTQANAETVTTLNQNPRVQSIWMFVGSVRRI
jgi:VIT family protein